MATPRTGSNPVLLCAASLALFPLSTTGAFEATWNDHTLNLSARTRLANIEVQTSENARAASQLLRANVRSQWSDRIASTIELDYVALAWKDEFSNGVRFNGKPIIPDVEGFDLNEAFLDLTLNHNITLTAGRKALQLGNERFVGSNNFWQNEQTFDTLGTTFEFGSASFVNYYYVNNANRINGEKAGKRLSPSDVNFAATNGLRPAPFLGDHKHRSHLVFSEFKEWDYSQLQAYYFYMDIQDAKPLSNKTLGLRYEFKKRYGSWRTNAHAELATQKRPNTTSERTLQYHSASAGLGYRSHKLSIHYERLNARNGVSFITPLASLHDQNGWADQFLITPPEGLNDASLRYVWRKNPIKIDFRYHTFSNDHAHIGNELDADIIFKVKRQHKFLLRYANFFTKAPGYKDQQRIFLMYHYNMNII